MSETVAVYGSAACSSHRQKARPEAGFSSFVSEPMGVYTVTEQQFKHRLREPMETAYEEIRNEKRKLQADEILATLQEFVSLKGDVIRLQQLLLDSDVIRNHLLRVLTSIRQVSDGKISVYISPYRQNAADPERLICEVIARPVRLVEERIDEILDGTPSQFEDNFCVLVESVDE